MRGLGEAQKKLIEKTKFKLLVFINENQPVTRSTIYGKSHIRRNKIPTYLKELEVKGQILQVEGYYFTTPFDNTDPNTVRMFNELKIREIIRNYKKIWKTFEELKDKQPIKFLLSLKKTNIPHHKHDWTKLDEDVFWCFCGFTKKKNHIYDTTVETLLSYPKIMKTITKQIVQKLGYSFEFFKQFNEHFLLYPKLQNTKYKNFSKVNYNPYGIKPKYQKKEGNNTKVDLKKLEKEYRMRKAKFTLEGYCKDHGNFQFNVQDWILHKWAVGESLRKGEISEEEAKRKLEQYKLKTWNEPVFIGY